MEQELLSHLKKKSQGTLELIHTMDNYLFVIDLEGKIILTSDSLFENTGMKKETIEGESFYKFLFKTDETPLNLYDLLLLDRDAKDLNVLLWEDKNNSPIDTMLISSSILSNFYKDQDYILILLADMREQRRAQMQMMQNNKMTSLGEMASGIAHEINNPLTVVMGQLNLLKKQIGKLEGDHKKITTLSDKIYMNFDRITKIVKSLQTISRNAEKAPMEEVEIEAILGGVQDLSSQRLTNRKIKFEVELELKDLKLVCRETEVLQVLLNLINNSVDSIEEQENPWIKVVVGSNSKEVEISVIDSGTGIDLETQIRLFEPFYTTKAIGKGTGLGLSISRSLIEAHGGSLVYDTGSKNTCFKLVLPA